MRNIISPVCKTVLAGFSFCILVGGGGCSSGGGFAPEESEVEQQVAHDDAIVTYIPLSEEETRLLDRLNGIAKDDGNNDAVVSGLLAVPEAMTEDQAESFKKALLASTIRIVHGDAALSHGVLALKPSEPGQSESEGPIDPAKAWCSGWHLTNVSNWGSGYYFPNKVLGGASGWGPMTLSVQVQKSVSAQVDFSAGISASVVNASLGYSQNSTYSVSVNATWNVPSGKYGKIEAFAYNTKHTWQVWDDDCGDPMDTYVGSGASYKPTGVIFYKTTLK